MSSRHPQLLCPRRAILLSCAWLWGKRLTLEQCIIQHRKMKEDEVMRSKGRLGQPGVYHDGARDEGVLGYVTIAGSMCGSHSEVSS
ncbi:hypothetical protein N657DRAFT_648107 [Parathielavia appendiculata]|uniref:Uncharacterized protein n=1 Tax=Parathielavia appendiculata TaxID=2587402 RepID=A0AAN6Z0W0_9PEZI|nr:hypothetical protein N657DRAFT_648107 [Parathielavia appendiculata]